MLVLGIGSGMGSRELSESIEKALPPMAGTLLIIAAGGGFKQTLVDAGVGDLVASWATAASVNVLLLGWLVAVGIRLPPSRRPSPRSPRPASSGRSPPP